jgi:cyclopropane fatty-acyl-phospholipid synthase-like methyltransferase
MSERLMGLFYGVLRVAYRHAFGRQQMLHYPLFVRPGQSLLEGQQHFSLLCASKLGNLMERHLLEVGCGNGEQAMFLHERARPASTRGVDLLLPQIACANAEAARRGLDAISFATDDAQRLETIASGSVDALLCTESAHHYPDKALFLIQVRRVLRPGGRFVIAELVEIEASRHGWLDGAKSTYYATWLDWRALLTEAGLIVEEPEDVSARLLDGLRTVDGWFPRGRGIGGALARLAGLVLVRHYRSELTGKRRYIVMSGARP